MFFKRHLFKLISFLAGIGIAGILCFMVNSSYRPSRLPDSSIAEGLLQSLQTSAAIYVAMQRVPPKSFSDFVTTDNITNTAYTLTINNITKRLINTPKIPTNKKDPLVLKMKSSSAIAKYYMKGTDITATFEGF